MGARKQKKGLLKISQNVMKKNLTNKSINLLNKEINNMSFNIIIAQNAQKINFNTIEQNTDAIKEFFKKQIRYISSLTPSEKNIIDFWSAWGSVFINYHLLNPNKKMLFIPTKIYFKNDFKEWGEKMSMYWNKINNIKNCKIIYNKNNNKTIFNLINKKYTNNCGNLYKQKITTIINKLQQIIDESPKVEKSFYVYKYLYLDKKENFKKSSTRFTPTFYRWIDPSVYNMGFMKKENKQLFVAKIKIKQNSNVLLNLSTLHPREPEIILPPNYSLTF